MKKRTYILIAVIVVGFPASAFDADAKAKTSILFTNANIFDDDSDKNLALIMKDGKIYKNTIK